MERGSVAVGDRSTDAGLETLGNLGPIPGLQVLGQSLSKDSCNTGCNLNRGPVSDACMRPSLQHLSQYYLDIQLLHSQASAVLISTSFRPIGLN